MLSPEEKAEYENEFNKFDTTRSGVISAQDFISKIKETDEALAPKEIKKMAKKIDYDDNAQINYSDFITATLDVKKCLTKERLKTIFRKFATTDEKKITSADIQTALDTYGFFLTSNQ